MPAPNSMGTQIAFRGHAPSRDDGDRTENEILKAVNDRLHRKLAEASRAAVESHRLAHRDDLTGLANRRLLNKRLQWAIANAGQRQRQLALMYLDLDLFKVVNDRFGHAIGDQLLTFAAARIAACVRSGDIACRYGGDEFVVLLPDISDVSVALRIARHIDERIGRAYRIEGEDIQITASVGLAIYPRDAGSYDALLRHADADMRERKLARRNDVLPASVEDCLR